MVVVYGRDIFYKYSAFEIECLIKRRSQLFVLNYLLFIIPHSKPNTNSCYCYLVASKCSIRVFRNICAIFSILYKKELRAYERHHCSTAHVFMLKGGFKSYFKIFLKVKVFHQILENFISDF